jgi:hypothetical protein
MGAVNYFLGLAICKLFAAQLLDTPWLLHLDVFRPLLNPVLRGRSRPDLVGQTPSGQWVAFECKGRASPPNATAKTKAKQQARRLVSVNGAAPIFSIGGITYFKNDVLQFYWEDPEPDPGKLRPIRAQVVDNHWQHYYAPTFDLIRSDPESFVRMRQEEMLMPVPNVDIQVGIHPKILNLLVDSQWRGARDAAGSGTLHSKSAPYHSDGIAVVAGGSWSLRFEKAEE